MSKSDTQGKPEGRLRLKNTGKSENISRFTKRISEEKLAELEGLNSSGTDDSLADFKSPKQAPKPLPKTSIQVIKNSKKNTTSRRKEDCKRDDNYRQNQQSIPSLFAKAQTEESTFVCPLCLKTFSESDIQSIHTKNCAAKNNISTEKLLAAVELHEKQEKERKAIGLPSKPIKTVSKKRLNSKKLIQDGDPDIQLALALSMSLKEVEQIEVLNEGIALAAESDDKILEMSSSQRKSTLQSFGFSTNRNAAPIIEKRRRKHNGPTILQSRTQEIREQILTDKIAEVLVGSESITQQQLEVSKNLRNVREFEGILRSEELKKLVNETSDLWSRSIFCFGKNYYYVEELREFFKPFSEAEKDDKIEDIDDKKEVEANFSPENVEKTEVKDLIDKGDIENNEGIICLSNDWSQMVASSYLSDVAIFVKDSSFIHAHNLVFWTRCHSLTSDYKKCNSSEDKNDRKCYPIKNKINWSHIDHSAALGFLRYVYCGQISSSDINNENILEQMKILGEKYKIKELVKYLEKMKNQSSIASNVIENYGNTGSIIIPEKTLSIDGFIDNKDDFIEEEMVKNEEIIENKCEKIVNCQINTSADLFEDSEIIDISQDSPKCSPLPMELEKSLNSDLIDNDNKQKSDLSRFIEKIERRQARDILESDTDEDTPVKVPGIYRRNPFKIGNQGDDYSYDWDVKKSDENDIQEVNNEKKTALSILEDEIRARTRENIPIIDDKIEEEKKSHDDDDDDVNNTKMSEDESLEESMYTRYMKQAKENSIEDYRNCIKYANVTQRNKSRRNPEITEKLEKNELSQKSEDSKINETIPHSFNISEDLNFDTWDDISDPSIAKTQEFEDKNTEKSDKKEILIKSAHNLSDEDDDFFLENDISTEININYSPGVKSPSPIVVSSEDEEISNEKRPMEIFSQVLSCPNSPEQLKDDDSVHNYDDDIMKTPLKNSQSTNKFPLTPKNHLKRTRTSSSLQISYDITPPINYNRMKSPELNEELNKYGLKPQKRSRAIQLLEHIYNELHPLVPVDSLPPETPDLPDDDDDDYEPVCKKRQLNSPFSTDKGINTQDDDDDVMGQIIPEEMDFYQENGVNHQGESICVKEVFNKLLKSDKELYVKVLAYAPLPLESLCEKLKSEGFNGKVNDVMNFLDDECITFQVQQQKRIRKGRNGKNCETKR